MCVVVTSICAKVSRFSVIILAQYLGATPFPALHLAGRLHCRFGIIIYLIYCVCTLNGCMHPRMYGNVAHCNTPLRRHIVSRHLFERACIYFKMVIQNIENTHAMYTTKSFSSGTSERWLSQSRKSKQKACGKYDCRNTVCSTKYLCVKVYDMHLDIILPKKRTKNENYEKMEMWQRTCYIKFDMMKCEK